MQGHSIRSTLRATAATLEISARYLLASRRGRATQELADALMQSWAQRMMAYADAQLTAGGLGHIQPGASYVVMSNHASFFDIPALYGTFPGRLRMVGKAELFKVPLWGAAMHEAGFIAIDRGDRSAAIAQLASAEALLKGGTSVWISPEGTRSKTGDLMPFKKGGFHVAINMRVPILPAYIRGTPDAMPPGSFTVKKGAVIHVEYGEPIPTPARGVDDLGELMAQVEAAMRGLRAAGG